MGAVLGCLAAQCVSCFTAAACKFACGALNCSGSVATRVSYAGMFLVTSLTAWMLTTKWAVRQLERASFDYLKLNCPEGICYGMLAVHRVCFALTMFHLIMACLLVGVKHSRDPRAQIQNGWWGPKIITWIGLTVASFFIRNHFFIGYGNYVAVVGAGVFIMIQLVLLVDFAHTWSEMCLENWEETGEKRWQVFIVGGALSLYAVSIALTGIMYGYFGGKGCTLNLALNSVNLALAVAATGLAVHPRIQESNPRSGLSQSSMVVAYTTYLIASAVANEPKSVVGSDGEPCNPLGSPGTQRTTVVLGAVFTFLALVYSTSRAATQGRALINDSDYEPINAAIAVPLTNSQVSPQNRMDALSRAVEAGALPPSAITSDQADGTSPAVTDDEREGTAYNYGFFHVIFAVAAMYVAMLLTDWNTIQPDAGFSHPGRGTDDYELVRIGQSMAAVWVKAASSWVCVTLYIWTLVAPVVMPERFGFY